MGIAFRPACPADASELVGLVEELGYPATPEALARRLTQLGGTPGHLVLVAQDADSGAILGWIHAQESLSIAADPIALVSGLVVDAEVRGTGVGRGLMQSVEDWARARGLRSLRLRAQRKRRGAHAFYRRLGFVLAKEQLQFRKELAGEEGR